MMATEREHSAFFQSQRAAMEKIGKAPAGPIPEPEVVAFERDVALLPADFRHYVTRYTRSMVHGRYSSDVVLDEWNVSYSRDGRTLEYPRDSSDESSDGGSEDESDSIRLGKRYLRILSMGCTFYEAISLQPEDAGQMFSLDRGGCDTLYRNSYTFTDILARRATL